MSSARTTGPWGIEKTEKAWYVGSMRPDGIKIDDFVCSVEVGPEYRDSYREKGKANATLIAAAPDLLESLKDVVFAFAMNNAEPNELYGALERQIDRASAAISKAEGRS